MRPKHLSISALTLDADGIAQAQQTAGAGNLVLNGVSVKANDGSATYDIGAAVLNPPRRVTLASTGNLSGVTFTITGRSRSGKAISEAIAGPNNNTVTTTAVFSLVSQIAVSGAVGTNVTVGWGVEGLSAPIAMDRWKNPFNVGFGCVVDSGTPTFTVEHTFDDIQDFSWAEGSANWFPHEDIADDTASVDGNYAFPVTAIRLRVSAGPGTVLFDVHQAG